MITLVHKIIDSFESFDTESQKIFGDFMIEKILDEYGIDFVVDILTSAEYKSKYQSYFYSKKDDFIIKWLAEKKSDIRKDIESKFLLYIRDKKINQIFD